MELVREAGKQKQSGMPRIRMCFATANCHCGLMSLTEAMLKKVRAYNRYLNT